jgi:hypothetical protein
MAGTTKHLLEEPVTGLYYAEGPDGPTLTPKATRARAFQTSGQAIAYATEHLAGQPAELARVAA